MKIHHKVTRVKIKYNSATLFSFFSFFYLFFFFVQNRCSLFQYSQFERKSSSSTSFDFVSFTKNNRLLFTQHFVRNKRMKKTFSHSLPIYTHYDTARLSNPNPTVQWWNVKTFPEKNNVRCIHRWQDIIIKILDFWKQIYHLSKHLRKHFDHINRLIYFLTITPCH